MKIVIDGNIGSGKTTQLDLLEKKGWIVRREPIDQWPLDAFYKDPKRWAFYFHMVILQTLRPIKSKAHVVYERSLMSSRHVFWPIMVKNGTVTKEEDSVYQKYYEQFAWFPDLYIFLAKDLDLAWKHIRARHQAGDSGVKREYLAQLGVEYEKLVKNVPCKVYVVNANKTVEEIHEQICKILEENELFVGYTLGNEMQTEGGRGRKMSCTPFTHMCSLS